MTATRNIKHDQSFMKTGTCIINYFLKNFQKKPYLFKN